MATSLAVDPTAVQGNEQVTREDGPSTITRFSVADNNNDQQLSLETAKFANFSKSITSHAATLRAEQARLKAELALANQRIADQDAELAKLDYSFNLVNMKLIKCVQDLMKADKPQHGAYSNQIDRILKYVEEQKEYNLKREMEKNLWLQR